MGDEQKKRPDFDSKSVSVDEESGCDVRVCNLTTGYLALRTACAYDESNEIGCLFNGQGLQFQYWTVNGYAFVYSPKLKKSGYVNGDYIAFTVPEKE